MSAAMQGTLNAVERSTRSVLIGNISPDASEEQIRDIFSEVGHIVNFRLFYDESGKPNSYGFCEYKDSGIAHCAMRNLNGLEFKGRRFHVDIAASKKSKDELGNMRGASSDSQVEESDSTEKAPEEISKAVASLPAEQMFELMKQMKLCIDNNPQEARNLLLQNPQLAYALLQAQVIMRIVEPQVALKILNRPVIPPTAIPEERASESTHTINEPQVPFPPAGVNIMPNPLPPNPMQRAVPMPQIGIRPPVMPVPPVGMINAFADQDHRMLNDQDLRQIHMEREMRPPLMATGDKDMRQILADQDMRSLGGIPDNRPFDPRFRGSNMNRSMPGPIHEKSRPLNPVDPRIAFDVQNPSVPVRVEDPRKAAMASSRIPPPVPLNVAAPVNPVRPPRQAQAIPGAAPANVPHDQEKAALIMQVLQLSDQQIASLPPEQRQSILVLKEQIVRTHLVP